MDNNQICMDLEQLTQEQRERLKEFAAMPEDAQKHLLIYGRGLIDAHQLAKASA